VNNPKSGISVYLASSKYGKSKFLIWKKKKNIGSFEKNITDLFGISIAI